jgi:hypothetical protein
MLCSSQFQARAKHLLEQQIRCSSLRVHEPGGTQPSVEFRIPGRAFEARTASPRGSARTAADLATGRQIGGNGGVGLGIAFNQLVDAELRQGSHHP